MGEAQRQKDGRDGDAMAQTKTEAQVGLNSENAESNGILHTAEPDAMDQASTPASELFRAAQYGDYKAILALVDSKQADVNDRDRQDISALHWAGINNHLMVCRYLLNKGAEVDVRGGDLKATPMQWAARAGHLDIVHLLISHNADPTIMDSQGYNTLHLATHSGNAMLVVYLLQQPISIDTPDLEGHSALMWAAFQGDALSADVLLRHGASVEKKDGAGLTALHWAMVKANRVIIRRLIECGADLEAKDENGQTPHDVAKAQDKVVDWRRAMMDADLDEQGRPQISLILTDDKRRQLAVALSPLAALVIIFQILDLLPWYTGVPLALALFSAMHWLITKIILRARPGAYGPSGDKIQKSPYFASVIGTTALLMIFSWLTTISRHTPGHALANTVFLVLFVANQAAFFKAMWMDPGFVPKLISDSALKEVVEELASSGQLNGQTFCTVCMLRKPMRSKHCRMCARCVARHDHHCPWIWNCIGYRNHPYFFVFVGTLVFGIGMIDYLIYVYLDTNSLHASPTSTCIFPNTICRYTAFDTYTFSLMVWFSLQLTWTIVLLSTQIYQVMRQLTTFEISNLGKYGYMGQPAVSTGNSSHPPRHSAPATGGLLGKNAVATLRQISQGTEATGDGTPVQSLAMGAPGTNEADVATGQPPLSGGSAEYPPASGGPPPARSRPGGNFNFLLQILGLDRFTARGGARAGLVRASGQARSRSAQNPFDMGFLRNCMEFWSPGSQTQIDYRTLYEIPSGGWNPRTSKKPAEISTARTEDRPLSSARYEPVETEAV